MKDNKDNFLDVFDSKEKAIHHALWLNFKYRIAKITFGVIEHSNSEWAVLEEVTAKQINVTFLDILPKDLSKLSYDDLRHLRMDKDPLPHLSAIFGMISTMDGEILRYLIHSKLPLEKLIRFELAGRGFDIDHRWCGFEKANNIWLK